MSFVTNTCPLIRYFKNKNKKNLGCCTLPTLSLSLLSFLNKKSLKLAPTLEMSPLSDHHYGLPHGEIDSNTFPWKIHCNPFTSGQCRGAYKKKGGGNKLQLPPLHVARSCCVVYYRKWRREEGGRECREHREVNSQARKSAKMEETELWKGNVTKREGGAEVWGLFL